MNFNQIKFGKPVTYLDGVVNYLKGAMIWGFRSKYKWSQTTPDIWGFANPNDIDPEATAIYNRIIADGGVSNLTRLNYFVVGLKTIYGTLSNVPVCYDAHWIGYKLGSGTGATAGQAAAKLYSLTVAGDAVQSTAASQPLLLAHNGASSDNYLYAGPGSDVAGAYCQTSTNVSPQVNTNFTFEFNFKDFTSRGILAGCPTASSEGWSLQIQGATNLLRFYGRNSSVNVVIVDSTAAITVTGNRWVKVVRSGNDYSFFEKADGGTYTQVGTTITNSTALNSYTLPIQIGSGFGTNYVSIGIKILRARFYNDATATNLVVDFNPSQYNASTSQTQWTSSTGEVWTISTGTATTGYKGVLVDRTIVMSDGVDDTMASGTVNINPNITMYCSIKYTGLLIYSTATDGASSLQRHAIAQDLNYFIYNGGIAGITSNGNPKILSLVTVDRVVLGPNKIRINNGSDVTGSSSSPNNITTFKIFNGYTNTASANAIINTLIQPSSLDSDTTKTAMYNLIRSLNNNAF